MVKMSHFVHANVVSKSSTSISRPLCIGADLVLWRYVVASVQKWRSDKGLIPTSMTLVLPFVQLIAPLRNAWCEQLGNGFLPRFETTQTWAARVGGFHHAGAGPTMDPVLDHLQAQIWLHRLDKGQAADLANALVEPLVNMANDLMTAAGNIAPHERSQYWEQAQEIAQQTPSGIAGVEAALGPLAVAWAQATQGWSTDVLFEAAQASKSQNTALVVLQAGSADALTSQLYKHWSDEHRLWLNLDEFDEKGDVALLEPHQAQAFPSLPGSSKVQSVQKSLFPQFPQASEDDIEPPSPLTLNALDIITIKHPPCWQVATDGEDEAERAAAQAIYFLNAGIEPIALCSQDRPIARRVWALLSRQNIALADETGWTLSTTRSAALAMGIVRCAVHDATPDEVLDAFKALPADYAFVRGLDALETHLRKSFTSVWPQHPHGRWIPSAQDVLERINALLDMLRGQGIRTLWAHLQALAVALKQCGAWSVLLSDVAGKGVLQALHLHEIQESPEREMPSDLFDVVEEVYLSDFAKYAQTTQMRYLEFTQWVSRTLESVTFIPPAPDKPQVVLTPLARVMLRPFAAVIIPGCDESRLTALPSLAGFWRESDRITLGLTSRHRWWQRLQAQWVQALRMPNVMLIWRSAEGSQPLSPASLVQRVIGQDLHALKMQENTALSTLIPAHEQTKQIDDARKVISIHPEPTFAPAPQPANRLHLEGLSASAYKTLRECPYRFYASYLLGLREQSELDSELTRRDYGNWLHAVLREFHIMRLHQNYASGADSDFKLLEKCAQAHAQTLDQASIIPWQARWPALRDAYLRWLKVYEREGGEFVRAEFAMKYALTDKITLQGRIDRQDQQNGVPIFIDYKTERRSITESRVKDAYEDVQLPFYALLAQGKLQDNEQLKITKAPQARAIYLSLDDRQEVTKAVEQSALQEVKQALAQGVIDDMQRLSQGHPAYPIGQAQACTYCAMQGLCRKAYWTECLSDERSHEPLNKQEHSKKIILKGLDNE